MLGGEASGDPGAPSPPPPPQSSSRPFHFILRQRLTQNPKPRGWLVFSGTVPRKSVPTVGECGGGGYGVVGLLLSRPRSWRLSTSVRGECPRPTEGAQLPAAPQKADELCGSASTSAGSVNISSATDSTAP